MPKNVGLNPVDLGMCVTEVFQGGLGGKGARSLRLCTSSRRRLAVVKWPLRAKQTPTKENIRFGN